MKAVALVITKLASGPLVTGQSAVLCPVQMRHMNNTATQLQQLKQVHSIAPITQGPPLAPKPINRLHGCEQCMV